jgi:hypothetical protein
VQEPRRRLLLELYRALQPAPPAERAAAIGACAAAWGIAHELEIAAAPELAVRLAVRLVHRLEMGSAPLCVRIGPLADGAGDDPVLRLAVAGAPLIAGREGRALLAIALDPPAGGAEQHGALVDSETCARIAVAGGELDASGADATRWLELAGDLVPTLPAARPADAPACVLLAAVRLSAADEARCLTRAAGPTMRRNDPTTPS